MLNQEIIKEITSWRREIHANPEIGFELHKTSKFVSDKLKSWGLDVHVGLAKTGVVGILNPNASGKSIAFRADMDALPIDEKTQKPWASKNVGAMHACGHDGHTAMLLGAAKVLSLTCKSKVYFIFQPAEENLVGGKHMVDEGLFDLVQCDEIYAMHNRPKAPFGAFIIKSGPMMASSDSWEIRLKGQAVHAASPQQGDDVISAGCELVSNLNNITSRLMNPVEPALISTTKIEAGNTYNRLPSEIEMWGTVRTFDEANQDKIEEAMKQMCKNVADMYGLEYEFEYDRGYIPLINDEDAVQRAKKVVKKEFGVDTINAWLVMGAEDFGYMLRAKKGAMIWLGTGEDACVLHNEMYDFDDNLIEYGVRYIVALAKEFHGE